MDKKYVALCMGEASSFLPINISKDTSLSQEADRKENEKHVIGILYIRFPVPFIDFK